MAQEPVQDQSEVTAVRMEIGVPSTEGIRMPASCLSLVAAYNDVMSKTGLDSSRLDAGRLVPLPIPLADQSDPRFASTAVEYAGWPMLWLPERLRRKRVMALQGQYERIQMWLGDDGGAVDSSGEELLTAQDVQEVADIEDDDQHALRIALEMVASGLYVVGQGWLDVCADAGVDPRQPAGAERVRRWRSGDPDEDLDGIDLENYLEVMESDDEDWAHEVCMSTFRLFQRACWAYLADDIIVSVISDDFPEDEDTPEGGEEIQESAVGRVLRERIVLACALASELLADYSEFSSMIFTELEAESRQTPALYQSLAREVRGKLLGELYEVFDAHADDLSQLRETVGLTDPDAAADQNGDRA